MDLEALKRAVTGSAGVVAPGASPNSTGANAFTQAAIGNIQNLATVNARSDATSAAGNALYGGVKQQSAIDAANEEAARQAAAAKAKQEASDAEQLAKDLADPSKYTRTVNESGGYDFFAPDGSKIDATDYARVQGKHVTDVVKGSQNTLDQEFLQDYKQVQDLGEAASSGTLGAYLKKHPELDDQLKKNKLNSYADVVKNFRTSYPQYFSKPSSQNIGTASYNGAPLRNEGNGILSKLKSTLSGIL